MATALCLALWCAAQCAASLAHAVGAAVTFAENYECCRFFENINGGSSSKVFSVSRDQQQQSSSPPRSKLSSALVALAAGPKWRGAIGGATPGAEKAEKVEAKESREVATQTGGDGAPSSSLSSTTTAN